MSARTDQKKTVKMTPTQLAIWVGEASGRTFKLMPQKGVITEPISIVLGGKEFTVNDISEEKGPVPESALACLELVSSATIPYKQVVIAHEVEEPKREIEMPEIDIDFGKILKTMAGIFVGLVTISVYAVFALASLVFMVDPILIIILDSPEEGDPWIALYEYL